MANIFEKSAIKIEEKIWKKWHFKTRIKILKSFYGQIRGQKFPINVTVNLRRTVIQNRINRKEQLLWQDMEKT